MGAYSKWVKPEVYPLFFAIAAAVSLSGFAVGRNLATNPDVRISKDGRSAGVLENYKEGKTYHDHWFRRWIKTWEDERHRLDKNY